jgi:NADH-quinone oxidoreductase subunit L
MTIPLVILAFFSVFVGFMNTPSYVLGLDNIFGAHLFTDRLEYSVSKAHVGEFNLLIALGATALALGAMFLAHNIYRRASIIEARRDPLELLPSTAPFWSIANARMYWDAFYERVFGRPFTRIAHFLSEVVDWRFLHDYVHDSVIWKGFNAAAQGLSKPVDLGVGACSAGSAGRCDRFRRATCAPMRSRCSWVWCLLSW